MSRTLTTSNLAVAAFLFVSGPISADAHHSIAATYDLDRLVSLSGTVTKAEILNPHVRIELTTRTEAGEDLIWVVEMAAPNAMVLRGINPREAFALGRQIALEVWPAVDGAHRSSAHTLVTPEGTRLDISDSFGRFMVPDPEKFEVIDRWAPHQQQ